jgi:hypothetical protein
VSFLLAQAGFHVDWSLNVGQILGSIVTGVLAIIGAYGAVIRLYHAIDLRLSKVEENLTVHSATLVEHSADMKKHENMMLEVIQDVARIVGQLASWNGRDRRGK